MISGLYKKVNRVYTDYTMNKNNLDPKEFKALFFIRNGIVYQGKSPSLRAIGEHLGFKSPRSAYVLVDRLIEKGYVGKTKLGNLRLIKDIDGRNNAEHVVELPLVGNAPCGLPLLAEENIEAWISISQRIAKPGAKYFLLRAIGNSMNLAGIKDGDLMLVRQQPVAENGDRVVALIDDSATIKEFHRKKDKIVLMPRSNDPNYKPIILDGDFMVQGVVINTLPDPLKQ